MASLAFAAVDILATRLLAALGVGVVAGIASEAAKENAKKRKEDADEAKSAPVSRADARTKSKEKCKKCPPDSGALVIANWSMSDLSREYQARVTGFAPYTEWHFSGVDFDGFRSSECLLLEAKARYDQFFDPETGNPDIFYRLIGETKMLQQATAQNKRVAENPPTRLDWYFMQPISYRYFTKAFATSAPFINTLLKP